MSATPVSIQELLAQFVPADDLTPELLRQVEAAATANRDADVDLDREHRCGFPEVIYGDGKPADLILGIVRQQQSAGQNSLVTRISVDSAELILQSFPQATHNSIAGTLRLANSESGEAESESRDTGRVFIVTAGSCDRPVAEEALETLRWMRVGCRMIQDVGVAGPHRLLRHVDDLRTADAIVCVAGMEAALPSVLGGHVPCPVIGVPTSVGYGASFGGLTALMAMLTCCASNVTVVNIDAGFKGGYLAGVIASRMSAARRSGQPEE